MTNKQIRLPKESVVGPGEARFIDDTDVEGHGWTNPAPPVDFNPRTPTHGGELLPDDVEDETGPDKLR